MIYFVSGHLDITAKEFEDNYISKLLRAMAAGARFVVGDARGCDSIAQVFLRDQPITVFHMFDKPRNNPAGLPTVGGFKSDEERDAAMTASSDADIAWVRPGRENSGTARNLARRPMKPARDIRDLLVLNPEHIDLSKDGPMDINPNGCTCHFLNPGQVCISCRGRAKAEEKCSKCGVGLFAGEEIARHKCSNCYYEEVDRYSYRD